MGPLSNPLRRTFEFQSVLAFRQQHTQPGAFGRSDLYFLCRLRPLTFELRPCSQEIVRCCWMSVEQLRREVDKSSITVRITDLVLRGLAEGFDTVDIVSEEHTSIHKGLKFHMFFRPLSSTVRA
nr:hypothetical protein BaRGS_019531 [Batillaria attramentaria]